MKIGVEGVGYVVQKEVVYEVSFNVSRWNGRLAVLNGCIMIHKLQRLSYTDFFVALTRLYVRMEQLGSHWTDFHEI